MSYKDIAERIMQDQEWDPAKFVSTHLPELVRKNIGTIISDTPSLCRHLVPFREAYPLLVHYMDYNNKDMASTVIKNMDTPGYEGVKADIISKTGASLTTEILEHMYLYDICICNYINWLDAKHREYLIENKNINRFFPCCQKTLFHHSPIHLYSRFFGTKNFIIARTIANKCEIHDLKEAIHTMRKNFGSCICFHCGRGTDQHDPSLSEDSSDKVAKRGKAITSKSGLTLHRKKCDPKNLHPHINDIAKKRMKEHKEALSI